MHLRPATIADADLLLGWRSDPATRAASFSSDEIPRDRHMRWLEGKLADERCALLIVEAEGEPVGQVRLDRVPAAGSAEIHIALAPAARGRSIGRLALCAAVSRAAALGVTRVEARVKNDNEPSLRAFQAAGFRVVAQEAGVVLLVTEP